MADVQLEHGYLRLANKLASAIALASWDSSSQVRLVMALIRATYGMRRKEADVGMSDWRDLTGMDDRKIRRAKLELQEQGVFVLVCDYDARSQTPQRWRLQKDFTKWGRFAVPTDLLKAAEATATDQGTPATPGDTNDRRGQERGEGSRTPLEQGSSVTGEQGSRTTPGTGSEPLGPNGSESRKTGKTGKTSACYLPGAHTPEELTDQAIRVANRGMRDNPEIGEAFNPIPPSHGSRQEVLDWLRSGISWEAIETAVYELASTYKPDLPRHRQINSMTYFTGRVHEEWDRIQADATEAPDGAHKRRPHPKGAGRGRGRDRPQAFDYSNATGEFSGFNEDPEAVPERDAG